MSNQREVFFADEEDAGSKLSRKAKESPFMVVGKFDSDQKLKLEENLNFNWKERE
jgi:hypothetical protein